MAVVDNLKNILSKMRSEQRMELPNICPIQLIVNLGGSV